MGVFRDLTRFKKTYSYYRTVPIVMATSGDITAVYAGTSLTGGGTNGDVTLELDENITVNTISERSAGAGVAVQNDFTVNGTIYLEDGQGIESLGGATNIILNGSAAEVTISALNGVKFLSGTEVKTDWIESVTEDEPVTIRGTGTHTADLQTDVINEDSLDTGVTVEGVLLKDGLLGAEGRDPNAIPVKITGDMTPRQLGGDTIGNAEYDFGIGTNLTIPGGSLSVGDVVSVYCNVRKISQNGAGQYKVRIRLENTLGAELISLSDSAWSSAANISIRLDLVVAAIGASGVIVPHASIIPSRVGGTEVTDSERFTWDTTTDIVICPTFQFILGSPDAGDVVEREYLFARVQKG